MTDNEEYFKSEGFRNLLKQYEASVNSGQPIYMDADDLADIADYYQFNGRMDEADAAISLALEYNPDAVGPLLYKASISRGRSSSLRERRTRPTNCSARK